MSAKLSLPRARGRAFDRLSRSISYLARRPARAAGFPPLRRPPSSTHASITLVRLVRRRAVHACVRADAVSLLDNKAHVPLVEYFLYTIYLYIYIYMVMSKSMEERARAAASWTQSLLGLLASPGSSLRIHFSDSPMLIMLAFN